MSDASARRLHGAVGDDLVARAHEVLAGLHIDLLRPARLGKQCAGVEGARAERGNVLLQPGDVVVAHEVEADADGRHRRRVAVLRSEEHTSELPSLMRISYAVFCLKKKKVVQQTKQIKSDST